MLDGSSAAAACGAPPVAGCQIRFGIEDGVPLLAVHDASENCVQPPKTGQSEAYQAEYQRVDRAATCNLRYHRKLLKRSATPREYSLIDRHIRRVGHTRVVLDIPCGDGPREAGVKP
jgi:hypothetical protein